MLSDTKDKPEKEQQNYPVGRGFQCAPIRASAPETGHPKLETLMAAAVLHDVVEDCNVQVEIIAHVFDQEIANLVQELTSNEDEIKEHGKTEYLKKKLVAMSDDALIIKLCDRLDNVRDAWSLEDREKQLEYFQSTNNILKHLNPNRKLNDIQHALYLAILDHIQLDIRAQKE